MRVQVLSDLFEEKVFVSIPLQLSTGQTRKCEQDLQIQASGLLHSLDQFNVVVLRLELSCHYL